MGTTGERDLTEAGSGLEAAGGRHGPARVQRTLVVANQTAEHPGLRDALQDRAARGAVRFHLLVPATRERHLGGALIGSENLRTAPGEDAGYAFARYRLARALRTLEQLGLEVTGGVGPPDPVRAAAAYLATVDVDDIVVCTLPRGRSRWVRRDVPAKLGRLAGVPVHHLELASGPARGGTVGRDRTRVGGTG